MGKAEEKLKELDKQIDDLVKERESAILEAKKEKRLDLEKQISTLESEIKELDTECTELEKNLKTKSTEFTTKTKLKDELISQKNVLVNEIEKKVINR